MSQLFIHVFYHICIYHSLLSLVSLRVSNLCRGADPLAVDSEGLTPLQLYSKCALDDVELLALLQNAKR